MREDNEAREETVEMTGREDSNKKSTADLSERMLIGIYAFFKGLIFFLLTYLAVVLSLCQGNIKEALSPLRGLRIRVSKKYTLSDVISDMSKLGDPRTFSFFGIWLFLGVFFLLIVVGDSELISLLWRPIAVSIYAGYFVYASFILFAIFLLEKNPEARKNLKTSSFLTLTTFLTGTLVVCFSQASRHLYLLLGGFTAKRAGFWDWLWFGFAHVADNASFDFFTIYNWHISSIEATNLWSRTIMFLFNLELELIVIAVVAHQVLRIMRKRRGK